MRPQFKSDFVPKLGCEEESWLSYIWEGYRMHFLRALLFLCKNGSIKHKGCRFCKTSIRSSEKRNRVAILSMLPIFSNVFLYWVDIVSKVEKYIINVYGEKLL